MSVRPDSSVLSRIAERARTLCIMAGQNPDAMAPNYGRKPGVYRLWELYKERAAQELSRRTQDQVRYD